MMEPRALLTAAFRASVAAADPARNIYRYLPQRPNGRTVVVGAGKASARMAAAFEKVWDGPLEGFVVTPRGFGVECELIEILEASHPVPDQAGLSATQRLLDLVSGLTSDDLVVALISGGGSALLPCPPAGLTLADEIAVNEALLRSRAPISAMNIVRKHISRVKGGRLALACHPAKVISLVVSDIPGDDVAIVASGPTIPSAGTRHDALDVIRRYGIALPNRVIAHLKTPMATAPAVDDPRICDNEVHLIASAAISLEASAAEARRWGLEVAILSDSIEGEARVVGAMHAAIAREVAGRNRPFGKPVLMLSGGETTVTLRANGRGGRNSEFLLGLAIGIQGVSGVHALAADTDGIDGSEDNAGAFADGTSVDRMRASGMNAGDLLESNDAWIAFHSISDLFFTGPTGTNVNDFRAILIT